MMMFRLWQNALLDKVRRDNLRAGLGWEGGGGCGQEHHIWLKNHVGTANTSVQAEQARDCRCNSLFLQGILRCAHTVGATLLRSGIRVSGGSFLEACRSTVKQPSGKQFKKQQKYLTVLAELSASPCSRSVEMQTGQKMSVQGISNPSESRWVQSALGKASVGWVLK